MAHKTDEESANIRKLFGEAIKNGYHTPSAVHEYIIRHGQSVSLMTVNNLLKEFGYVPVKEWQKAAK
jgi:acyl dehydratase